jgi:CheY-like chemotaxis protein
METFTGEIKMKKSRAQTILLVDDEPLWLDAMKIVLKDEGYRTITVTSGEEALLKLQTRKPDLIMTDVRMPVMNGFDLFQKIREIPKLARVPIVFMSSIDDYFAKRTARELGAQGYITKPSFTEDLKRSVESFLREPPKVDLPGPLSTKKN